MLALLDGGRLDGEPVLAPSTAGGMLQRQELVALWRSQVARWLRLLYALNSAAAACFIWFAYYWNLFLK